MKIISIKWKHGSSDFVHVIANEDVAEKQYQALRRADPHGLFDLAVFLADSFNDALDYVKTESHDYVETLKTDKV